MVIIRLATIKIKQIYAQLYKDLDLNAYTCYYMKYIRNRIALRIKLIKIENIYVLKEISMAGVNEAQKSRTEC